MSVSVPHASAAGSRGNGYVHVTLLAVPFSCLTVPQCTNSFLLLKFLYVTLVADIQIHVLFFFGRFSRTFFFFPNVKVLLGALLKLTVYRCVCMYLTLKISVQQVILNCHARKEAMLCVIANKYIHVFTLTGIAIVFALPVMSLNLLSVHCPSSTRCIFRKLREAQGLGDNVTNWRYESSTSRT